MNARSFVWIVAIAAVPSADAAAQIADRTGPQRGRGGAAVVVTPRPGNARGGRDARVDGCYDGRVRRGVRDVCHDWYNMNNSRQRVRNAARPGPVRIRFNNSIVRAHNGLLTKLDRDHVRWHRSHGWTARNRGWQRSHEAMHRRLDREHDRWHRKRNVPFSLDRPGYGSYGYQDFGRPGRGRGVVLR